MSKTKKCPFCAEKINVAAILCKHCKRNLSTVDLQKVCKYCREEIAFDSTTCNHCGASLNVTDSFGNKITLKHKSRMLYMLGGIYLGIFGIHNFYTGHYLRGGIKLVIFLFMILFGILLNTLRVTENTFNCYLMICAWSLLTLWIWTLIEIYITNKSDFIDNRSKKQSNISQGESHV